MKKQSQWILTYKTVFLQRVVRNQNSHYRSSWSFLFTHFKDKLSWPSPVEEDPKCSGTIQLPSHKENGGGRRKGEKSLIRRLMSSLQALEQGCATTGEKGGSRGGNGTRRIHDSYIMTATCLIWFLPPTLARLIRTEARGIWGNNAVLKAVDAFGSERLSQQRECSSVHDLTAVAHRHTQGAELASKVHSIYKITFLIVIIF